MTPRFLVFVAVALLASSFCFGQPAPKKQAPLAPNRKVPIKRQGPPNNARRPARPPLPNKKMPVKNTAPRPAAPAPKAKMPVNRQAPPNAAPLASGWVVGPNGVGKGSTVEYPSVGGVALWAQDGSIQRGTRRYWEIQYLNLIGGASFGVGEVQLTSGEISRGFFYGAGNVHSTTQLIMLGFGACPESGDRVGMLVDYNSTGHLKTYYSVNDRSLGLPLIVGTQDPFRNLFPVVLFSDGGKAVIKSGLVPANITKRFRSPVSDLIGQYKIVPLTLRFHDRQVPVTKPWPTLEITRAASTRGDGVDEVEVVLKVVNSIQFRMVRHPDPANQDPQQPVDVWEVLSKTPSNNNLRTGANPEIAAAETAIRSHLMDLGLLRLTLKAGDQRLTTSSDLSAADWVRVPATQQQLSNAKR